METLINTSLGTVRIHWPANMPLDLRLAIAERVHQMISEARAREHEPPGKEAA